jgi:hypothetical protein
MSEAKALEHASRVFGGPLRRVSSYVVRGSSLVLHDPEGSHYKIRR